MSAGDDAARKTDKAVIDHLAENLFEPKPAPDDARRSPTTSTGLPVEEQIRKQWNPRKGGLPILSK